MKKNLLSFVCLLTMALPSLAVTKTYQLVTDPKEILNPENQFIMVNATPLQGGIYAAPKTTSATINAVKIYEGDSTPSTITVDAGEKGLGLFSFKPNGSFYAMYESEAKRYWGAGTSSTNMQVSASLDTSSTQYQISVTVEAEALKITTQKATTRYFAFQLDKAGTKAVVKNYVASNMDGGVDNTGNSYAYPLFYKEVDESLSAVQKVEIGYEIKGVEGLVTLTCPTPGAKIFYGFSEDSMDNEYSAPFTMTKNCTVYAYAEKDGEKSNINSLDIQLPYTSFKDLIKGAADKDNVTVIGDFQVIRHAGKYLMLTDGTSNILVYNTSEVFSPGDKISSISAVVLIYANLFELTEAEFVKGGDGAVMEPRVITTFEGLNYNDNLFDYVEIKGCNISGKSGASAKIELGDETIALYDTFGTDFENGVGYDITGFVWRNYNNLQIVPDIIEGGKVVETVETPVISPEQYELMPEDKVTITCTTENVKIYYTLDESDPTEESTFYDGAFAISGDEVTVKARAFYAGTDVEMLPSDIASQTYHVWDNYCNVITVKNYPSENSYSQHDFSIDGVEYSIYAMQNKENIQMNNDGRSCYIIQTNENQDFVLKSIAVDYNDREIPFVVRGSNIPFSTSQDNKEYKDIISNEGVEIGTISPDKPYVEFTGNYKYFALYPSNKGVVYLNSVTINYRDVVEAPDVPTLKAEDAVIDGDNINCTDNLTINFEAPEGIHVYYSLGTAVDAPKKAHGDPSEPNGFTKHNGQDVELTASHKTLSFYACDPTTGLHSSITTYTLNIATGIAEIDAEDADAIYFNLQGVQISKPENGVYIRVKKGQTEKIVK